jgi:uncharacterized protein YecT (DUF1311 family)
MIEPGMNLRSILALMLCLCSVVLHAQTNAPAPKAAPKPPVQTAAPDKCQSGTPQGELACLSPDLKELENAMERQLYQLSRKLSDNERTKGTMANSELRASQSSWRQFRNQFCSLEALAGSGQNEWLKVRQTECAMRLTKDRLESLRDIEATLE